MIEDADDVALNALADDVDLEPNEAADPPSRVDAKIPAYLREKYEFLSYRNAAVILAETWPDQFAELCEALRDFTITTGMIRTKGGNESDIPKQFSDKLRACGWHETIISGDLVVTLGWREQVGTTKSGKSKYEARTRQIVRKRHLDGHKIDYVKGRVAFDLEWNSKDQTFDRDLYAFNAFFLSGAIDVGVIVTRGASLNPIFPQLGNALRKDGTIERDESGKPRLTKAKFGASTTWWGKLVYRLNAGRNGGCPVLAVGITPACISDWPSPGPPIP